MPPHLYESMISFDKSTTGISGFEMSVKDNDQSHQPLRSRPVSFEEVPPESSKASCREV